VRNGSVQISHRSNRVADSSEVTYTCACNGTRDSFSRTNQVSRLYATYAVLLHFQCDKRISRSYAACCDTGESTNMYSVFSVLESLVIPQIGRLATLNRIRIGRVFLFVSTRHDIRSRSHASSRVAFKPIE